MGRGGDPNGPDAARQGRHPGQQAPYGGPAYGGGPGPGHAPGGYGAPQPQWQARPGGQDEPEYFGPQGGHDPYGRPGDSPGHTQQFGIGDAPDAYGAPAGRGHDGYGNGGYGDGAYGDDGYGDAQTYGAQAPAPPPGPRLHWKDLLTGVVLRPSATFWQMRDHALWGPALIVTFVYGLLAVFGFDKAREDVLNATLANSFPLVLTAGVLVLVSALIMGAVTHTLARQLGGDGLWQPTIGLSMLIMSITDAPRLVLAVFLGGDNTLVQLLGWATWLLAGYLLTSMVSKSHDLPWPRALGASAIQLVALLSLIKLGTL
ncbi:Yip1 family protein [Streptomyces caatingaensis]|nr:Yip1 family protein [Streptomyces caatingaensis]